MPRPEVPFPSEPPSPILPPVPEEVVHQTISPEVVLPTIAPPPEHGRIYNPVTELPDIWSHKPVGSEYWKEWYNDVLNYPSELYTTIAPWLSKDISDNSLLDVGILTMVLGIGVTLAVLTR